MSGFRLSAEAEQDLNEISAYLIGQGGIYLARHVLREIHQAMRFLVENPEAGHRRTDLTKAPVKFWQVFSYLIIYDPKAQPLGIARVLHSALDLEAMFRKQPPRVN